MALSDSTYLSPSFLSDQDNTDNVKAYLLPNDEREQERLDGQHQMWIMALEGKLHLAPLNKHVGHVLDVATGTGIWALEFVSLSISTNGLSCFIDIGDHDERPLVRRPANHAMMHIGR